jgi:hypothetical protein
LHRRFTRESGWERESLDYTEGFIGLRSAPRGERKAKRTFGEFLSGRILGIFANDTKKQVKVMVQRVKAPCTNRKTLVVFFEPLDDSVFPLETVLLGRQMSLAAASRNAV